MSANSTQPIDEPVKSCSGRTGLILMNLCVIGMFGATAFWMRDLSMRLDQAEKSRVSREYLATMENSIKRLSDKLDETSKNQVNRNDLDPIFQSLGKLVQEQMTDLETKATGLIERLEKVDEKVEGLRGVEIGDAQLKELSDMIANQLQVVDPNYFKEFEDLVQDEQKHPATPENAMAQLEKLSAKVSDLLPLQRVNATSRIERLEWSLNVLRQLAENPRIDPEDEAKLDLFNEMRAAAPADAPKAVLTRLEKLVPKPAEEFKALLGAANREIVNDQADAELLSQYIGRIEEMGARVGDMELAKATVSKLRRRIVERESIVMAEDMAQQLNRVIKLEPESAKVAGLASLESKLVEIKIRLQVIEDLAVPEIVTKVETRLRTEIDTVNASAREKQEEARLAYQSWALKSLREVDKIDANKIYYKTRPDMSEQEVAAMMLEKFMLPIAPEYLDRTIREYFEKRYNDLWSYVGPHWQDSTRQKAIAIRKKVPGDDLE